MPDELGPNPKTLSEYLLYKIDRSIAIVGIIALGAWALYIKTPESINLAGIAMGGLIGYVGGRTK